ncbi:MAG: thioredoxin [Candidatus Nanohaloarchaea archaeon]
MPVDIDPDKMDEIQNSEETWIIDFWADWCQPCKVLAPHFEEASEEFEDVNFGKVDMEEHQSLGTKLGVRALPTMVILSGGDEVARKSGAMNKSDLVDWIKSNL